MFGEVLGTPVCVGSSNANVVQLNTVFLVMRHRLQHTIAVIVVLFVDMPSQNIAYAVVIVL